MMDNPQKNKPIIAIMTGQGVIEKPITLSERILKSNDFYWSKNDHTITFVRRDMLKEKIANLMFIRVTTTVTDDVIEECKTTFNKEYFNLKNETVLKLFRKQITPLFLAATLIILTINFFINSNIADKNSSLQQELSIKRKKSEQIRQQTDTEKKLLAEIKSERRQKISITIDKIASVIPENILLFTLSIDPLIRSPENKKPLLLSRNTLIIKGATSSSNELILLTNSLSKFLNEVKIKKIEETIFEIEARL